MTALYVENNPFCADWLRGSIAAGLIAPGLVDDRDIRVVTGDDCRGFTQVHLFAGIGLWSLALRAAGVGDECEVWSGSCPCPPFSRAGPRSGFDDPRHLWPEFHRLIADRHPAAIVGEQVAPAPDWLAMVRGDLEAMDYAMGTIPIEAAGAGARHRRDRHWFLALADRRQQGFPFRQLEKLRGTVGVEEGRAIAERAWRSAEPDVRVLVDGDSLRVPTIKAIGNAIDIRPAVAFLRSFLTFGPESY